MMKKTTIYTTIIFFCFLTEVSAENGHVDIKYLSENYSALSHTQNLEGFGIEIYKNFKKEFDGQNFVEKSFLEKRLEKKLYSERHKGTNPLTIAKLENKLSREREKRQKLMVKQRASDDSKIGIGLILGFKYLDGYNEIYSEKSSVQKQSLEVGLRINW